MRGRKFSLAFLFVSLAGILLAWPDIRRDKARYYYTQGSLEAAAKHLPEAYEYYKKAYELDPSYIDASFSYGNQRLFVQTDTLQSGEELKRSLRMMQEYVDEFPGDLYASEMYGFVTTRLDTIEESIRVYERVYDLMPKETHILMNLAEAYMMQRKGKEAVSALEKYENIEGKSPQVSMKKITCFLAEMDTLGAVKEVEELVEQHPFDPFSRLLKGNLYDVIGNQDSVYASYKIAESLAPESGAVKMSLANYYRNIGDSVMLDNMMYEALLSEDFGIEDKISILGEYLQKLIDEQGEKSRGDYLFGVLMEQYPHEPSLLDISARYSAAKGDFREAAETIEYAIDLDATNDRYWLMLMSYLLADSRYGDIVDAYQRAITHIEPDPGLKNLYSAAASQLENPEEGKEILWSLIDETSPELRGADKETIDRVRKNLDYDNLVWVSNLYCMIGDLDYKSGDAEDGFEAYETSLMFFPDNALTLNNYAYFLAEADKDLEKAKKMSRRSLDLAENNPTYLDTYAWILYKLGEFEEALDYQKLAIELAGEDAEGNEEFQQHLESIERALK